MTDPLGHIPFEVGRSHFTSHDANRIITNVDRFQGQFFSNSSHSSNHKRSCPSQQFKSLKHGLDVPDTDKYIIGTSPLGQCPDFLRKIFFRGGKSVGCTEFHCRLEFVRMEVHRDQGIGTDDVCSLKAIQSNSSTSDHHCVAPGLHRSRIDHRACTGDDSAGQKRSTVKRHVFRNRGCLRNIDHHFLSESSGSKSLEQSFSSKGADGTLIIKREVGITERSLP